jgi:hypothetical protein
VRLFTVLVEPLLLPNLGSRFLLGWRAVTPLMYCSNYSVEHCPPMYCRSLNEILDLFGCISAVWFEFQIQTHFLFLNQLILMFVRTPIFAYKV